MGCPPLFFFPSILLHLFLLFEHFCLAIPASEIVTIFFPFKFPPESDALDSSLSLFSSFYPNRSPPSLVYFFIRIRSLLPKKLERPSSFFLWAHWLMLSQDHFCSIEFRSLSFCLLIRSQLILLLKTVRKLPLSPLLNSSSHRTLLSSFPLFPFIAAQFSPYSSASPFSPRKALVSFSRPSFLRPRAPSLIIHFTAIPFLILYQLLIYKSTPHSPFSFSPCVHL